MLLKQERQNTHQQQENFMRDTFEEINMLYSW